MARRRITSRRLRRWLRSGPLADPAELLGLDDEAREELAWHAHRLFEAGEPARAERLYLLIGALWPGRHWLGVGACRQALGDLDRAEQAYGHCLEADPTNVHALANRAEVLLLTDRPEPAASDLAAARAVLDRGGGQQALRDRVDRLTQLAAPTPNTQHPTPA